MPRAPGPKSLQHFLDALEVGGALDLLKSLQILALAGWILEDNFAQNVGLLSFHPKQL